MERPLRFFATCLVLVACSPSPASTDGGRDDGGPTTCLALDERRRFPVLHTGRAYPLQVVEVEADAGRCVGERVLEMRRIDAPGDDGLLETGADGVPLVRADTSGVYGIFDQAAPGFMVLEPLFFARLAGPPLVSWPRSCGEVHRVTGSIWACDGALYRGTAALPTFGARRWLLRSDGSVLAAKPEGIVVLGASALGTDAGTVVAPFPEFEAWAVDSDGVSIASDAGFFECVWSDAGCRKLGDRFGTGELPVEQQSLIAFMRRNGRTLFSLAPAGVPFCEAGVQRCSNIAIGGIVAMNGDVAWGGSNFYQPGAGQLVEELLWDGGWVAGPRGLTGPPGFFVQGCSKAITPSRVIYGDGRQFLFWSWDSGVETLGLVELESADAGIATVGAAAGYFWVSVESPQPVTIVFPAN